MNKLFVSALLAGALIIPSAAAMAGSARTAEPQPPMMTKTKVVKHHHHPSPKNAGAHRQVIPPYQQTPAPAPAN
ncbi:hypothetical protein GCM10007874_60090 [Labrys miyagiensis]|uniref:Uncharacterized protein n=1 Tax=Labrys miyagiensis TaxID=346912 RepID=A0ABQ6CS83_9HYPH|nr:hypothetical protein [Labrys miyagiensis]GLS22989.1 hypothetical protein GCM10007874_60090 [Labrys miyagiensis]